ncbi:MAG: hypothetical protein NC396_08960 [Bacteroides sp.]|nr:hypothetical protein [Bacteroides sp.]MCM1086431.1 hypothetical protein [Bacteroides sp.]
MKAILAKKFRLWWMFLLLLMLIGTSPVCGQNPYGDYPSNHQNVFSLTAKLTHQTSCSLKNENTPHHFLRYYAIIVSENLLQTLRTSGSGLVDFKFSAELQENKTSQLDIPLVDDDLSYWGEEFIDCNINKYYIIIGLQTKLRDHNSQPLLYTDIPSLSSLMQTASMVKPIGSSSDFNSEKPVIVKLTDMLNTTLRTVSYSPGCEVVEFNLQTKCGFVINDPETIYKGYPYRIAISGKAQCNTASFIKSPETHQASLSFNYSDSMFNWEYTHGNLTTYLPLEQGKKHITVAVEKNPELPVGTNILVRLMDGRDGNSNNTKNICFYPDIPQPTQTGFQRIPEGSIRLQELKLKFNRSFNSAMEEKPTLLTVYSKVGQQTDGTLTTSESTVLFQEAIDMSKFNGLTYTTSVANHAMTEGKYYVTVEGTVRNQSNHPTQNTNLPDNIKSAIFQVVPVNVGFNDIVIEKVEFTPPACYGGKGKLKVTLGEYFVPLVSKYPVFYYLKNTGIKGTSVYDTLNFRCTNAGTQNNCHSTFECDHITSAHKNFKIVIPAITSSTDKTTGGNASDGSISGGLTVGGKTSGGSGSPEVKATGSSPNNANEKIAYFQINFSQPQQLDFPMEVKHNSGYYYVNRQLKMADDGKITVSRSQANGGTPAYSFFFRDDFANLTDKALTGDVISTPNIGNRYITIKDSKGCSLTKTAAVGNLNGELFVKLDVERNISCYNVYDGILKASIEKKTSNPLTFSWYKNGTLLPGKTSSILYDLGPGTYRVVMTDTKTGMASSDELTLTQPTQLKLSLQQKADVDCFGDNTGVLALKGSGGVSPYLYLWDGVDYGSLRRNLSAGTYRVKLIDHNSCELNATYTITQPDKFEIVIDSVIHAHYGTGGEYIPGRIMLHSQGGTKPYKTMATDATDLNNLEAGTYRFEQYDTKQCRAEATATVNFYDKLEIKIVQDRKNLCAGDKIAACHVEITGGVPPFDIRWSNGKKQAAIDSLEAGLYNVKVTDAAGVTKSTFISVITPARLTIDSLGTTNPTYYGCTDNACPPNESDGKIDFTLKGGTAPYTQHWSKDGHGISAVRSGEANLAAGTYELSLTDRNGCEANRSFILADIPPLHVQIETVRSIDCHGNNSGVLNAQVTGGTPPYRYTWANMEDTNATVEGLATGVYQVSVTDSLGVQASASLLLEEPEALRILVDSVVQPSYPGSENGIAFERRSNGKIHTSAQGGTQPYQFSWKNEADDIIGNQAELTGLSDGTYRLNLRDQSGCLADTSLELPYVEALLCSASIEKPVSCFGMADALLQAHIQGGKPPYAIEWLQNGSGPVGNLARLENRACANYTLRVTDSLGVQASFALYLPQPDSLQVDLAATNGLCHNDSGGMAVALVQGGTLPYTYRWNTNGHEWISEDSLLTRLENADIRLSASDRRGCTASASVFVTAPEALVLEHISADPTYAGSQWQQHVPVAQDGAIELFAQGGTAPYRFLWNGEEGGNTKEGLDSGSYRLSVIDAHNCRLDKTVRLNRTPNLLTELSGVQEPLCADSLTGMFRLSVQGGLPPYTFDWYRNGKWIGDDSLYLREHMGAGTYKVSVRDANGITGSDSLAMHEPERVLVRAQIEDATAWTLANGGISTEISGGVPPYTLSWSNGSRENAISWLKRGGYRLDVYDDNRCHSEHRYMVNSPDSLFISSLAIQHCRDGKQDGAVRLSLQGGLPPFRYEWKDNAGKLIHADSGNARLLSIEGLNPGIHRFYLVDSGGAVIDRLFEISMLRRLEAALLLESPILCHGEATAAIQAWIRGGKEPYSCTWHTIPDSLQAYIVPLNDNTRLENLPAGTYRLSVRDAAGDTCSRTLAVTQAPALGVLADVYPAPDSDTVNDGCLVLRPQGGRPPYRYLWNTGNTSARQDFSRNTRYEAMVTDAEGCTALIDLDSVVSNNIQLQLTQTADILCFGEETGALRVEISNGKPPFAILWSNGATQDSIANLAAGLYTVRVSDAYGRTDSARFLIRQPEELHNGITVERPSCQGFSDGSIRLETEGGNGYYTYAWNTGEYTAGLSKLRQGTYIVRTADRLQCTRTDTVVLTEPERLHCALLIDSIVCPDESGRIDYHAHGGTEPYLYRWSLHNRWGGEELQSGGQALIDPAGAGWYSLNVTDRNRCAFDTGMLLVNPVPPSYRLKDTQSLCLGQSLYLLPEGCDTLDGMQFLWIYPDGKISESAGIQTQAAGLHRLTLIQNRRCVYRDSVLVEAFNDSIHAEFWVSSSITARQSCLLVNLSEHHPDSIAWHVPSNVKVLNREGNYLEVQFPSEGTYTVGMTSYKGACSESTFRQVEVMAEQYRTAENPATPRLRWQLAPNPTRTNCLLTGQSDRKLLVRYRLVRAATGQVIEHGNFSMEKDGTVSQTIFKGHETAGMYILLLEYGNQNKSFKIVKL